MASLVLRNVKGTALTFNEVDDNFSNLNDALPSGITYNHAGAQLSLNRIGEAALTVDLSQIKEALPTTLTYDTLSKTVVLSRDGLADLSADISPIFDSAVSMGSTLTVAGNINTSGGVLQTNGTTRIDNTGVLTNVTTATQASGTNNTTLATTAFVQQEITENGTVAKNFFFGLVG